MTRRKVDEDVLLTKKIGLRVSNAFYNKMEAWLRQSNCRSIAELARDILYQQKIIWYHKDASQEAIALELAMIRKELNAIGKNINQVTRYFHNTDSHDMKTAQAGKVADEFTKVGHKVERLLELISRLTESWSPK